jgi:hypothetical protein
MVSTGTLPTASAPRLRRRRVANLDPSWDAVWDVTTRIDSLG